MATAVKYFYVLSQTWSPALKYHSQYVSTAEFCYWVLHGLWMNPLPTLDSQPSADLSYKKPTKENCLKNLKIIAPALAEGESDEEYQKSRYVKHGTPIIRYNQLLQEKNPNLRPAILTPEEYLCTAAELALKYNMGQYLKKFLLDKEHQLCKISEEINTKLKVRPYINCLMSGSKHYMDQIYLCFNEELKLVDAGDVPNLAKYARTSTYTRTSTSTYYVRREPLQEQVEYFSNSWKPFVMYEECTQNINATDPPHEPSKDTVKYNIHSYIPYSSDEHASSSTLRKDEPSFKFNLEEPLLTYNQFITNFTTNEKLNKFFVSTKTTKKIILSLTAAYWHLERHRLE